MRLRHPLMSSSGSSCSPPSGVGVFGTVGLRGPCSFAIASSTRLKNHWGPPSLDPYIGVVLGGPVNVGIYPDTTCLGLPCRTAAPQRPPQNHHHPDRPFPCHSAVRPGSPVSRVWGLFGSSSSCSPVHRHGPGRSEVRPPAPLLC